MCPGLATFFQLQPGRSANGSRIIAISLPGFGTVDVRVTNHFVTSPAVPVYPHLTSNDYNDQYTFNPV
jgi:hypothetical protein